MTDVHTKCECCGTEYLEPVAECDWCPEAVPQPVVPETKEAVS